MDAPARTPDSSRKEAVSGHSAPPEPRPGRARPAGSRTRRPRAGMGPAPRGGRPRHRFRRGPTDRRVRGRFRAFFDESERCRIGSVSAGVVGDHRFVDSSRARGRAGSVIKRKENPCGFNRRTNPKTGKPINVRLPTRVVYSVVSNGWQLSSETGIRVGAERFRLVLRWRPPSPRATKQNRNQSMTGVFSQNTTGVDCCKRTKVTPSPLKPTRPSPGKHNHEGRTRLRIGVPGAWHSRQSHPLSP
jgi:hypothetical protein